jgi:hypothetical protein
MGSGGTAPFILNLGAIWRCLILFISWHQSLNSPRHYAHISHLVATNLKRWSVQSLQESVSTYRLSHFSAQNNLTENMRRWFT